MYYDISAIKDRMNICDTCDNLGIQRKRSGAYFSIPCPNPSHFERGRKRIFFASSLWMNVSSSEYITNRSIP